MIFFGTLLLFFAPTFSTLFLFCVKKKTNSEYQRRWQKMNQANKSEDQPGTEVEKSIEINVPSQITNDSVFKSAMETTEKKKHKDLKVKAVTPQSPATTPANTDGTAAAANGSKPSTPAKTPTKEKAGGDEPNKDLKVKVVTPQSPAATKKKKGEDVFLKKVKTIEKTKDAQKKNNNKDGKKTITENQSEDEHLKEKNLSVDTQDQNPFQSHKEDVLL